MKRDHHRGGSRDILHLYSDRTHKNIRQYFFNTQWIFCTAKRGYLIVFIAHHYMKDVSMDAIFFQHNLEQRLKVFARDCVEN